MTSSLYEPLPDASDAHLTACADLALDSGQLVVVARFGVVLVPDMIVMEATLAGENTPPTARLTRPDGRTVYVFAVPEGWVA